MSTVPKTPGTMPEQDLIEQTKAWVAGAATDAKVRESVRDAVSLTSRLRDAERIDPKRLHEPITR